MVRPDFQKGKNCWKWMELLALFIGLAGTAAACLASYGWHWFKESVFFMIFSAVPYALLLLGNTIARRVVKSNILQPVTALLAAVLTSLSLLAYVGAVRNPNHSSGMIFAILPLCWMIAIPIVLTVIVLGFLVVERWSKN